MKRRDPVTGLTGAELAALADEVYENRDDANAWEDEAAPEIGPDVRSVVSVRFSRGELSPIERAAAAADVPVSTFIRNAAINAVSPVDLDDARECAEALQEKVAELLGALGSAPAKRTRGALRVIRGSARPD